MGGFIWNLAHSHGMHWLTSQYSTSLQLEIDKLRTEVARVGATQLTGTDGGSQGTCSYVSRMWCLTLYCQLHV